VASRWLEEQATWFAGRDEAAGRRARMARLGADRAVAKREALSFASALLRAVAGRPSHTRKGFEIGLRLAGAGVRAARPLGLIEERCCGLVRTACLILEAVDAPTLRDFLLLRLAALEPSGRQALKGRLWSALTTELARLHAAGVRQRDLKAPNILVAEGKDGSGGVEVTFVDLEGMALLPGPPPEELRLRDLARLAVSLRERDVAAAGVTPEDWRTIVTRYLEAWRGAPPAGCEVDDTMARTLEWAAWKEARNRAKGRMAL
jgi:hypothetical protein